MNYSELFKRYKVWISSPIFSLIFGGLLSFIGNLSILYSIIIILLGVFIPVIFILIKELKIRNNQLSNTRGMEREMNTVVKILNSNGDVSIHSRIIIINRDKNPIIFLSKDIYTTPGTSIELKEPIYKSSSNTGTTISERVKNYYDKQIKLDNKSVVHKYVDCDYEINPPLRNPSDYIKYDLEINALGHAKNAFTDKCEIDGFIVKSIARKSEFSLILVTNGKIKLIDFWIEDIQANRIEYIKNSTNSPKVINNDNQIQWIIDYPRMNYLYLFKYKIEKR